MTTVTPPMYPSTTTTSPPGDVVRPGVAGRVGRLLSGAVVILLAASSLAGLLVDGLYQDPDAVVSILRGYDLATLAAAVPLLAVTLAPPLRSSTGARLVTAGTLAFVVYDYAYVVFGTAFNDLFLLHVATFSAALFALITTLVSLDVTGIAARFGARAPVRTVATILGLLAASLAGMWIVGALDFAFTGAVPDDGNALVSPIELTHLGYAMDLALLVPAYATAAVLLWRRRPWGYALGVVLLVAGALTQLTYIAGLVFQARADVAGATAFDPFAPVILGVYVIGAGLLLAHRRGERGGARGAVPLT